VRRLRSLHGACAVVLALVVTVAPGCGDDGDNGPSLQANETDMAFATDMLAHHELGLDAADLAPRRAEDRVIRVSARDLIQLQSPEAQVLRAVRRTLAEGGVEAGDLGVPDTTLDTSELRRARDFDAAYAAGMIDHHRVAIAMSEAERRSGVHEELRRMSGDIIDLARFQIRQLERWRRSSEESG
jgi:uncharacterized protein (DUF305 family)